MGTTTEYMLAAVVLLTEQVVYCSAQAGGCSPPPNILMSCVGKLTNNVPMIIMSGTLSVCM